MVPAHISHSPRVAGPTQGSGCCAEVRQARRCGRGRLRSLIRAVHLDGPTLSGAHNCLAASVSHYYGYSSDCASTASSNPNAVTTGISKHPAVSAASGAVVTRQNLIGDSKTDAESMCAGVLTLSQDQKSEFCYTCRCCHGCFRSRGVWCTPTGRPMRGRCTRPPTEPWLRRCPDSASQSPLAPPRLQVGVRPLHGGSLEFGNPTCDDCIGVSSIRLPCRNKVGQLPPEL